jgi:signal peptidase I
MDEHLAYNPDEKRFLKKDPSTSQEDGGLTEIIRFALIAIALVLPIRLFIAQPFIVSGTSMIPTFENGEYIIVDQLSYKLHEPVRGDVVIFKFPEDTSKYFIKRVIGLPGETIIMDGQKVTIVNDENPNGFPIDEPYIKNVGGASIEMTLEDDEFFVMGDNRTSSYDSRFWGPLGEDYVVGRAFIRLLPASSIDFLPGDFKY